MYSNMHTGECHDSAFTKLHFGGICFTVLLVVALVWAASSGSMTDCIESLRAFMHVIS